MIVGVGVDIVDMSRIERLLREYGDQFARRILANTERPAFEASSRPVWFLANRFAAKEALSKALGTGLRYPVTLHAISVSSDGIGKPALGFHGPLPDYLASRGVARHHLSLSHDKGMACAVVILEQ
ncbi:MAG: holo-ACP synthase [Betaproteobacteria bacterium]|nr:holo-ACP synthase [Betaproteobacteria bacterium]